MQTLPDTITFDGTDLAIIDRDGQAWLTAPEIARALEYARTQPVTALFTRNRSEFTDDMQGVLTVSTPGGNQRVQAFSPRGTHLLAMFARTERAAAFRRWVLDVLDNLGEEPAPAPEPPMCMRVLHTYEQGRLVSRTVLSDDACIVSTGVVSALKRDFKEMNARINVLLGTESATRLDTPL